MIAASSEPCLSTFARRSSTSTSPFSRQATTTTFMPAITADAAFVPCAEDGMRQTVRSSSPRERWYSRMASRPAYSPWLPALGWRLTAA